MPPIENASKKYLLQAANFSYLGIFFGVAVVSGYLLGAWGDRRLHSAPWLMLLGVLCGIAAGFKELYRLTLRYRRESSASDKAASAGAADAPAVNPDDHPDDRSEDRSDPRRGGVL